MCVWAGGGVGGGHGRGAAAGAGLVVGVLLAGGTAEGAGRVVNVAAVVTVGESDARYDARECAAHFRLALDRWAPGPHPRQAVPIASPAPRPLARLPPPRPPHPPHPSAAGPWHLSRQAALSASPDATPRRYAPSG